MIETLYKTRVADAISDTPLRRQDTPKNYSKGFQEFSDGIHCLVNKPRAQFAQEVASHSMETKRIPDPYFYEIGKSGELISPSNKGLVRDVVLRDSKVGELEFQALLKIENWAKDRESGAIAWISPPERNVYDVSKIIVSEIREQDGKRILFNRAIVLDINEADCLRFAQSLANYSCNKPLFTSKDALRATPFELNPAIHWSYVLEELLPDLSLEKVRSGEDLILKETAVNTALDAHRRSTSASGVVDVDRLVNNVGNAGMMGERGSSCPPKNKTAFGMLADNAKEVGENCEKVRCKRCGWEPSSGEEQRMESGEITSCPGRIKGEDGKERVCGWAPGQPV